jgi:hypothetical protein
MEDSKTIHA